MFIDMQLYTGGTDRQQTFLAFAKVCDGLFGMVSAFLELMLVPLWRFGL